MPRRLTISIVQCVLGPALSIGKFFQIETYPTSDGIRTRVCNGVWDTLIEAQKALEEKGAL